MPGVQRAGRRLRPGRAAHPGGARRGRLRGHRLQDLDLARRGRRLVRAAGAHRPGRAQAQGDLLAGHADGRARGHGTAAAHPRGVCRVRGGVPGRGPGAGRQPGRRRERRLAGHDGHPVLRARHRLRRGGRRLSAHPGCAGAGGQGQRPLGRPRTAAQAGPAVRGVRRAVAAHAVERQRGAGLGRGPRHRGQRVQAGLLARAAGAVRRGGGGAGGGGAVPGGGVDGGAAVVAVLHDRGGTSQIQRNIVAERILGLPKGR